MDSSRLNPQIFLLGADNREVVSAYAAPLEELFERSGVRFERDARVMERPFVYAHAPHT